MAKKKKTEIIDPDMLFPGLDQLLLETNLYENEVPEELPLLPLRDTVIFPYTMFPVLVGREPSVQAINEVSTTHKFILLSTQITPEVEDPETADLHKTGVLARVVQVLRLPNNLMKVLVSGIDIVRIRSFVQEEPYMKARFVVTGPRPVRSKGPLKTLIKKTREKFER